MPKNIQCMISGSLFDHPDPNVKISPFITENLCYCLSNDENLRKVFFSSLSKDDECMKLMAESILNVDAEEVGISVPGTLADFFLSFRSEAT